MTMAVNTVAAVSLNGTVVPQIVSSSVNPGLEPYMNFAGGAINPTFFATK